jgi:hypothetical protein
MDGGHYGEESWGWNFGAAHRTALADKLRVVIWIARRFDG